MTLHLTLKMTTAQVVETSVTNNSLSKDYPHLDDNARQTTDTPGFKLLTMKECLFVCLFVCLLVFVCLLTYLLAAVHSADV